MEQIGDMYSNREKKTAPVEKYKIHIDKYIPCIEKGEKNFANVVSTEICSY